LGDNVFYGQGLTPKLKSAVEIAKVDKKATVFGYQVKDPHRFGVVEFDKNYQAVSIEEKPDSPKSNYAVTGLYFYPNSVVEAAKKIKPSHRNELEITSVNKDFLEQSILNVEVLGRGFAWLDTGTNDSLIEASQFVQTVEHRQGYKIACLEEIAYANNWLSKDQLKALAKPLMKSGYGEYLIGLIGD
jgi:glucose-1-phosphate thymidylyltransferase